MDPDLRETQQPYQYAGEDPVDTTDPSGLYSYQFYWYLGQQSKLGTPEHAFNFFVDHAHEVFPFDTGNCGSFYLGEKCVFSPGAGEDHLHVSSIEKSELGGSMTLKVDHWCQSPGIFGLCAAGDPVGSTITFTVGSW